MNRSDAIAAIVVLGALIVAIAFALGWSLSPTGLHNNDSIRPGGTADRREAWQKELK